MPRRKNNCIIKLILECISKLDEYESHLKYLEVLRIAPASCYLTDTSLSNEDLDVRTCDTLR